MKTNNTELDIETKDDSTNKPVDEPNYKDLYIRSVADFDNFKKNMNNKMNNVEKNTISTIISDIIAPIYNDLRRGVQNDINGCDLILKNVKSSLDRLKIKVIDDDIINKQFNTDYMNAISSVNCNDPQLDGTVECVIEPGFIDESNKAYVYAKVVVRKYLEE